MEQLFEAVRAACPPGVWSRGVELARAGSVVAETRPEASENEFVLRVAARGALVTPTVSLFPDDAEWECDCDAPQDACLHVAAAVIAVRRVREDGGALDSLASRAGHVGYRFHNQEGALAFDRVIVLEERGDTALPASLRAIAAGTAEGPSFVATDGDLAVEKLLGARLRGVLPEAMMLKLLRALAGCDDIRIEGAPVRTSTERVLPLAVVEDRGAGFQLELRPAPGVKRVFSNGVAHCEHELRPLGEPRLTHREWRELPRGRYFAPEDAARLVSEVIPSLESRLSVEIHTDRLPITEAAPPRLRVDVRRDGDELVVRGALVYGDPPRAEIRDGRLIHLQGAVPVRNARLEDQLRLVLLRELELASGEERAFAPAEAIAVREKLEAFSGDLVGEAHRDFVRVGALEPRISYQDGKLLARFETGDAQGEDARSTSAEQVLERFRAGESLVPLDGGGFAELPAGWLERHGRLLGDLIAARDSRTHTLPPCALPDLATLLDELGEPPPPGFEQLAALLEPGAGLPEPVLPDDLQAVLRTYQRDGVRWLAFLRDAGLGALLADDMGLGKTLQALCAMRGRTLVVCPTSVLQGWEEQIEDFRPGLRLARYHGSARELDATADVTLTSYAILRLDAAKLAEVAWGTVILDEAQAIKNPRSQGARAAYALSADCRMALTGTPVENRLDELWSQLRFTNPGLLGPLEDFRRRYARPIGAGDEVAAAHLRRRIRPFVLRRLKRDVAPELPPRTEAVLHSELDENERAVYEAVRASTRSEIVERLAAGGGVIEALEALLRLRQAACHAGLVPGQTLEYSSKVELLVETLEEVSAEGHRSLVFSQWTSLLDRVEPALEHAGLDFLRLDGSTRDRASVVRGFQADDGPPVLLISLRAGGTGLNLTAADHVFLIDPWWNPAVEDQAADRAHRIGQDKPVLIHRLVSRDTVEERILGLQRAKRALAETALADAGRGSAITRDELLALLD